MKTLNQMNFHISILHISNIRELRCPKDWSHQPIWIHEDKIHTSLQLPTSQNNLNNPLMTILMKSPATLHNHIDNSFILCTCNTLFQWIKMLNSSLTYCCTKHIPGVIYYVFQFTNVRFPHWIQLLTLYYNGIGCLTII